ncbi:methylated-DNA--[protein]-cysteine S-methyltransferase [Actinomadura sp. HBU206391]|uniref:methylated-DNA--[protein]-cysteine S-methyltransferase n=1 Tax=Actinomadura sp. HBU206391 TaxID=2731692 RepID=UPI00164FADE3|nr:methylated-DNA--[protein]-cysteine S-methyltransferase [Actinomadura sp. HBU206391]MBC6461210.1 methylated-DNA--[protein]-cysteine S-methyltransferase [Actinomadura sp. HBU206391]
MSDDVAFGGVDTPVGRMLVAVTGIGLAAVGFDDSAAERARLTELIGLPVEDDPARTAPALEQVAAYFAGRLREFTVPIDWRLTSRLQRQVLATLHESVPYGEVVTYGGLGERSGTGVPARVIGQIMGSNPIPLVVPCHRVLAGNGLGGYSGGSGVEIKRWLLTLEGALPATLDWDPDRGPVTL